jgi:nucleoside-diphosphate-sugar epimerase
VSESREKVRSTVVLAGGAGMVGQNLTPLLQARGDRVVVLDKNRPNLALLARLNPGVETHLADLAEPGPWMDLFGGAAAVVDLKAQIAAPGPELFERNNVRAQRHILEACRRASIRHLIHLSSSVVISVARDAYSETKRQAERLVRESGVLFTTLRPPLMFGCFDVKHLGYISRLLERTPLLPIPGSGRYLRQPLYVMDLCRIILVCLGRPPSNAAHDVIGHERLDFIDLIRMIARARRLHRVILPTPLPLFALLLRTYGLLTRRPAFVQEQLEALVAGDDFPVSPWVEEFGVRYTPFSEGLEETLAAPCLVWTREMVSPHTRGCSGAGRQRRRAGVGSGLESPRLEPAASGASS